MLKDTQITTLILDENWLFAEGGEAIAAVLKDTKISHLSLEYNELGLEGGKAIADVLKDTQITTLKYAALPTMFWPRKR